MSSKVFVRVIVGAEHSYACIKSTDQQSLDVLLPAGKGVEAGLKQREAELHERIARLARRANMIRAAYTENTLPEVK